MICHIYYIIENIKSGEKTKIMRVTRKESVKEKYYKFLSITIHHNNIPSSLLPPFPPKNNIKN
jgi:hypothetical protein